MIAADYIGEKSIDVTLGSPSAYLPGQTNNTEAIDITKGQSVAVSVRFVGIATTTATISCTNAGGTTNGCSIAILGTSNTLYAFTNSVTLSNSVPTNKVTLVTIVATNKTVYGDTLSVILGASTNTYTFTNEASAYTTIDTNATGAGSATNIYNRLVIDYPAITVGVAGSNVTLQVSTNANLSVVLSSFGTNGSVTLFTSTNLVAANSLQISTNSTPAGTATNLYTKLLADFGSNIKISYGSSTSVVLTTYTTNGLSVTNAGNWATVTLTTNAALGTLTFSASNSLDRVNWFRDSARDFTTTIASGGVLTNFNSIGAIGYLQYSIASPTTNGAASGLKIGYSTKTQ